MRTQYQRRSWTSLIIWMTACAGIAVATAWQFNWWPTTEVDMQSVNPQLKPPKVGGTRDGFLPVEHYAPTKTKPMTEAELLAAQSEPDGPNLSVQVPPFDPSQRPDFSDFPSPPQLLPANPDAKPIPAPSRLVQTVEGELPPPSVPSHLPNSLPPSIPEPPPIQLLVDESPMSNSAPPSSPTLPAELKSAEKTIQQIDAWLASSDPKQELLAHKELSTLYWNHPEAREFLRSRIEKTAKSIYFSPQPHYMTPYTVQPGDQLAKISRLYKVPWEYLATLNNTDPRKIRPGKKLKVIKGPFAAVVDLHRFELTIQHHGFFVKRYKVGIGKDGTSPIGEFPIKNKLTNPTYYGSDGNVIGADDPQNPLGEYWIDIGDSYGIHGTIEPTSIGKAESKGCIRMLNHDAAEVYGFLGVGAKVIIRR